MPDACLEAGGNAEQPGGTLDRASAFAPTDRTVFWTPVGGWND